MRDSDASPPPEGNDPEHGHPVGRLVLVWCEVCGKELWTTSEDAFASGWDFAGPGGLYPAGIISPRTCGGCTINRTVWWRLTMDNAPVTDLTPRELAVVKRILDERPPSP